MDFSASIVSDVAENQQIHDTPGNEAVYVRQAARDRQADPEPETVMGGEQVTNRACGLLGTSVSTIRRNSESRHSGQTGSPVLSSKYSPSGT
jgi:hypothetical protein